MRVRALLAQLVEHFHGKEGVIGSSPMEGFVGVPCVHGLFLRSSRADRALRSVYWGVTGALGCRWTPQRCPLPRVPGGTIPGSDDRQTSAATALLPMSENSHRPTPFDDLEPFAVLTAQGIAARLGVERTAAAA